LKMSRTTLTKESVKALGVAEGAPALVAKLEYAGPRTRLGVLQEYWINGRRAGESRGTYALDLPLTAEVAFGFGDAEGTTLIWHISAGAGANGGLQRPTMTKKGGPAGFSLKDRAVWVREPKWPLEAHDEDTVTAWTVIIPLSPGEDPGTPVEAIASQVLAVWRVNLWVTDKIE
jgi:hypothetical protein